MEINDVVDLIVRHEKASDLNVKLLNMRTNQLTMYTDYICPILGAFIKYHQDESDKILNCWWSFIFHHKELRYHMRESNRLISIWSGLEYLISFIIGDPDERKL